MGRSSGRDRRARGWPPPVPEVGTGLEHDFGRLAVIAPALRKILQALVRNDDAVSAYRPRGRSNHRDARISTRRESGGLGVLIGYANALPRMQRAQDGAASEIEQWPIPLKRH